MVVYTNWRCCTIFLFGFVRKRVLDVYRAFLFFIYHDFIRKSYYIEFLLQSICTNIFQNIKCLHFLCSIHPLQKLVFLCRIGSSLHILVWSWNRTRMFRISSLWTYFLCLMCTVMNRGIINSFYFFYLRSRSHDDFHYSYSSLYVLTMFTTALWTFLYSFIRLYVYYIYFVNFQLVSYFLKSFCFVKSYR